MHFNRLFIFFCGTVLEWVLQKQELTNDFILTALVIGVAAGFDDLNYPFAASQSATSSNQLKFSIFYFFVKCSILIIN